MIMDGRYRCRCRCIPWERTERHRRLSQGFVKSSIPSVPFNANANAISLHHQMGGWVRPDADAGAGSSDGHGYGHGHGHGAGTMQAAVLRLRYACLHACMHASVETRG